MKNQMIQESKMTKINNETVIPSFTTSIILQPQKNLQKKKIINSNNLNENPEPWRYNPNYNSIYK